MASVEIIERSSLIAGLRGQLALDPRQTAIVTIDMHRGHLDMDVATMPAKPEDAKRVIAYARAALDLRRGIALENHGLTISKVRRCISAYGDATAGR